MSQYTNRRLVNYIFLSLLGCAYWLFLRIAIDPRPLAAPHESRPLSAVALPAGQRWETWLGPATGKTVRLTAGHTSGEVDAVYGLLWGTAESHLAIGLSPLGYVTIEQVEADHITPLLPLQTFPHVRGGTAENALWVETAADQLTIRLNSELLWETSTLPFATATEAQIGLWGQSFGGATHIHFTTLDSWP